MNYYRIIPATKKPVGILTYSFKDKLDSGDLVIVPFGSAKTEAVVIDECTKPSFETKSVVEKIQTEVQLPDHLLSVVNWLSEYYNVALSLALRTVLPVGTGKARRELDLTSQQGTDNQRTVLALTQQQKQVIDEIEKNKSTTWLHGDTGSGKTRIYVELVDRTTKQGKDSLVLVPEISLTPQLVEQFRQLSAAENVFVIHSGLSESKRHQIWKKINTTSPCLVIGTRSALFSPLKNLGLIVIDEAHESSYHQDKHPKYSSLRVAGAIAKLTNAKLVLGSATPPIEEIFYSKQRNADLVSLSDKIHKDNRKISLVDLSEKTYFKKNRHLSDNLIDAIGHTLSDGQQTMLLLNRRGTRQSVSCENCGWFAECENCLIPLKYHHDDHTYRCHLCGLEKKAQANCPDCGEPEIKMVGLGTKQLVLEVQKLFPSANVFRYDQEALKKHKSHQEIYKKIQKKQIDIIVGTQLIAKGFDLPRLRTVAAINADSGFNLPDFSCSQKTFQIIYQLAGRSGRRGQESNVFVQTFMPSNYAIRAAREQNYNDFYQSELEIRKKAGLPPFVFLLKLECKLKSLDKTIEKAQKLKADIAKLNLKISVFGPTPSFHEYSHGYYHWQIVVKSKNRKSLQLIIEQLPSGWDYELDPETLL